MTCSVGEHSQLQAARREIVLALFIALAVGVHTVETLLPTPFPWFRIGLANVLTVLALFLYGGRAAWAVTLARVGLGSLLLGRLFSPGFWLALSGGVVAVTLMVLAWHLGRRWLGPVGISVLGAAGHATGQMVAASLLLVKHAGLWQLFPIFLCSAVVSGVLTGWVASALLEQVRGHRLFSDVKKERTDSPEIR